MAGKESEKRNQKFIDEYERFLSKYLFRLLGISHCQLESSSGSRGEKSNIIEENGFVYFLAKGVQIFRVKKVPALSEDNLNLAKNVVDSFFQFSEYNMTGKDYIKHNYLMEDQRRDNIYNMAIQVGICRWITGGLSGDNAERLLNVLERWAVKTYEGRNVTMGFVIDPTEASFVGIGMDDWISFLEDDYAAVLSDCIHSVFLLDKNCNFLGYRSISESSSGNIPACLLNEKVPLRFMHIVQQFLPENSNKVGMFLLANGDILLAKNGVTRFVKRNMQWLNLSYDAFMNSLQEFRDEMFWCSDEERTRELISSVYASVLDVSFSHTGGIISIVGPKWEKEENGKKPVDDVLSSADNLLSTSTPFDSEKELVGDQKKLILKKTVIRSLIGEKTFPALDRKLRSELIAMDGACILDLDGRIYSFGAIIQNDSGSTGGARSAAAKKLSRYGMAVKVSTDGYIEAYVHAKPVYVAK